MYALIIVIAMLSPATGTVTPVGVTSQTVGKFKNLDQCKAAANRPLEGRRNFRSRAVERRLLVLRLHRRQVKNKEDDEMSSTYAAVSALIFAIWPSCILRGW